VFWKRMFGDKPAPEQAKESGFFKKLVSGLEKTKQNLVSKVEQITSGRRVDESLFEELEEVLIEADCGVATAMFLVTSSGRGLGKRRSPKRKSCAGSSRKKWWRFWRRTRLP